MMTAVEHPLVVEYLARLRHAAGTLPREQADELVADIEAHLIDALDDNPTEPQVRDVLDRLGPPSELVEAADDAPREPGPRDAPRDPGRGRYEAGAALLLIGSAIIAPIWFLSIPMWIAGLVLLVLAPRWTTGEKVLGALAWAPLPGLTVLLGATFFVATQVTECTSEGCETTGAVGGPGYAALAFALAYLAFAVWATVKLVRAARRA